MKKSSLILLTLAASFSITMSAAQTDSLKNHYPADYLYEVERMNAPPTRNDTARRDSLRRDSVNMLPPQQQVIYINNNYYYRSRFWDGCFRIFAPRRYYAIIRRPGYVPRHVRGESHGRSSAHRGGFGRHGSGASQSS